MRRKIKGWPFGVVSSCGRRFDNENYIAQNNRISEIEPEELRKEMEKEV